MKKIVFLIAFLSTLLYSFPVRAVYVQIHMNRPLLNNPNVVVSTFYDNEIPGPYHVTIYSAIFGTDAYDLLYMQSYDGITAANLGHNEAMGWAVRMFPDVESPQINLMLANNYHNTILPPPMPAQEPRVTVFNDTVVATFPDTVLALPRPPSPQQDDQKVEETTIQLQSMQLSGCKDPKDEVMQRDNDDDPSRNSRQYMPDFTSATIYVGQGKVVYNYDNR